MVAFFKKSAPEDTLDARIAGLSRRAQPLANDLDPAPTADLGPSPSPPAEPEMSEEERLALACEELQAQLSAELSQERVSILSRGELAKVVDTAVQTHFARSRYRA